MAEAPVQPTLTLAEISGRLAVLVDEIAELQSGVDAWADWHASLGDAERGGSGVMPDFIPPRRDPPEVPDSIKVVSMPPRERRPGFPEPRNER